MILHNTMKVLEKLALGFPVVSITGPRCPDFFSYIKGIVDKDGRMGLFILTGSVQFGLRAGISQSLAGRVGSLELLLLSLGELKSAGRLSDDLDTLLFTGGYPPIYNRPVETSQWQAAYISTYLERDVRQLINVKDIALFQRFLRICAHHVGQLVNLTQIANDCGITHKTAESWLSVLESSYLIRRLQPWYRNFNKRLVKTPKLYFYDRVLLVGSWVYVLLSRLAIMQCVARCSKILW